MFNSYEYNPTQKVNINAVSGTLSRTCERSFFFSCAVGSANFDSLMKDEPRICLRWDYPQRHADVIILQAMLMGDDRVMFELIKKSDYEELRSLIPIIAGKD